MQPTPESSAICVSSAVWIPLMMMVASGWRLRKRSISAQSSEAWTSCSAWLRPDQRE
jgi:hypothetical protein